MIDEQSGEANTPQALTNITRGLKKLAQRFNKPIVISTHPRTKSKLDKLNLEINPLLTFHEPFGFIDYCKLQKESRIVFSDSGSVSEESVVLDFKAITIRDSMERPEALESGSIIMSGLNTLGIIQSIEVLESGTTSKSPPYEYLIPDTSTRVINYITSTIYQHKFWSGLRNQ